MNHLGDRAAALADDQLDHDERDRALAHLAHCPRCRAEVDEQRRVKAALTSLRWPAPSAGLLAGLARLAEPGEPVPRDHPPVLGTPLPPPAPWRDRAARSGPASRRPGRGPRAARRQPAVRPRTGAALRVAAASVLSAAVTLGLAALGAPPSSAPAPTTAALTPAQQAAADQGRAGRSSRFAEPAAFVLPRPARVLTVPTPAPRP